MADMLVLREYRFHAVIHERGALSNRLGRIGFEQRSHAVIGIRIKFQQPEIPDRPARMSVGEHEQEGIR